MILQHGDDCQIMKHQAKSH